MSRDAFGIHTLILRGRVWFLMLLLLLACSTSQAQKKTAAQPAKPTNEECLACHSDPALTKDVNGKQVSLTVHEDKFKNSVHGGMLTCADCHTDVKGYPHDPAPKKVTACETCHADEVANQGKSLHMELAKKGNTKAPAECSSCHGSIHEVLPSSDPKSAVSHANIPKTCGTCHGVKFVEGKPAESWEHVANTYSDSVHGKAIADGKMKAAVCSDCHDAHLIQTGKVADSKIFKFNIPATCGKCHEKQAADFKASIHGASIEKGNWKAPVCSDCHGIHNIKGKMDPNSPVAAAQMAQATCAQCHESMALSTEFGMSPNRVSTYLQSYHGLANKMGSKVVANCASCHGAHKILPSNDPASSIHKDNLLATCGQCHAGATAKLTTVKVHNPKPLSADSGSIIAYWVRKIYLMLIIFTIGGMAVHNLIIWRKKAQKVRKAAGRVVVRMSPKQRLQHWLLLTSFITLVITGFALAYPESFLARAFVNELVRSWIHRVAAIVMIVASLYHVYYLAATKEGRKLFMDFLPTLKDATDAVANMKYYLGLGDKPPQFARFNYADKMEYWALVWGTFVMVSTGFMLWFAVWTSSYLPGWALDVATLIHFYEAILATLAILVWHFYFVIFDPDVYPINWAFFDGKVSTAHLAHHHPLEFAEWAKQNPELASRYAAEHAHEHEEAETAAAGKH